MSEYQAYKARFDQNRALLQVPPDCTCGTPAYRAGGDLFDPQSWDFSWVLTFSDESYIYCHEIFSCRRGKPLQRRYFSFHYGPIVRNSTGGIDRKSGNPVDIRIDKEGIMAPAHMHYRKPHPFPDYKQNQIIGLTLEDIDMFHFVGAIFRARLERIEIHDAMGFKYE